MSRLAAAAVESAPSPDVRPAGDGPLHGLRVIDVTGPIANYTGKMFADLGADVILVEPLGGSRQRTCGPFAQHPRLAGRSLSFLYKNTNKRSIAVDLTTAQGQAVLARLAASADLLIEDTTPGDERSAQLDPAVLVREHPHLVVTSISLYGRTGPNASRPAADIVGLAAGGLLWLGGYTDGPPVQIAGEQAFMAGSVFAAYAALAAVSSAESTGIGEHIDVSVQEAVALGLENAIQFYDLEGAVRRRAGGDQSRAGSGVFPCKDGHVVLIAGGVGGNRFWKGLLAWLSTAEAEDVDALRGDRWGDTEFLASEEARQTFWDVFTGFAATRTKEELTIGAQEHRAPCTAVNTLRDILSDSQFAHRGFFVPTETSGQDHVLPGAPYRLSRTPWAMRRPAPDLGEHTEEILTELDFDRAGIVGLREAGVVL